MGPSGVKRRTKHLKTMASAIGIKKTGGFQVEKAEKRGSREKEAKRKPALKPATNCGTM